MEMFLAIVRYWVQLPGFILLLYIFALLIMYWARAAAIYLFVMATVLFYSVSTPVVAAFLANTLEKQYPPFAIQQVHSAKPQAIVVLGGGRRYAPEYQDNESVAAATAIRVDYAAFLQQKTHLPIFAVGAGANLVDHQQPEAQLMQQVLQRKKVIQDVHLEVDSVNTYENALYAKQVLEKFDIKHFILVTSASHMPRAMKLFQSFDLYPIAAPTDYLAAQSSVTQWRDWMPAVGALVVSARIWHEYLGLLQSKHLPLRQQRRH